MESRRGDGLGPLLFSLGLDEHLTAVGEAMRDLSVDSNMIGQVVHVVVVVLLVMFFIRKEVGMNLNMVKVLNVIFVM